MTMPDDFLIDLDDRTLSACASGNLSVAQAQTVIARVGQAVDELDSFDAELLRELALGVSRL